VAHFVSLVAPTAATLAPKAILFPVMASIALSLPVLDQITQQHLAAAKAAATSHLSGILPQQLS